MNAVLLDKVAGSWRIGDLERGLVVRARSRSPREAGLLFVAAQAGFVDGPRVMANMAVDSWLPHRFAALSERLSMQNGVMLMGVTSLAALLYTHGDVEKLVVMYSINVFLTFSLSNLGMSRFWIKHRKEHADWFKHLPVHLIGLGPVRDDPHRHRVREVRGGRLADAGRHGHPRERLLRDPPALRQGGRRDPPSRQSSWPIRSRTTAQAQLPSATHLTGEAVPSKIDVDSPVAVLFVGGYGGLGRHALLTLLRMFPGHFKGVVFCSVAVIDSGNFKGIAEVHELESRTQQALDKYVRYAAWLGLPAESTFSTGIEVAVEAEKLAKDLIQKYPRGLFVAGQLIFDEDTFATRLLHNESAFMIQRRLQHAGVPMVVLPVRLNLKEGPRLAAPSLTEERAAS